MSQFNGFNWNIDIESHQVERDSVWSRYKIVEIGGPAEYAQYKKIQAQAKEKDAKKALMLFQAKKNKLVTQITSDEVIDISKDLAEEEKRQKKEVLLTLYHNDKQPASKVERKEAADRIWNNDRLKAVNVTKLPQTTDLGKNSKIKTSLTEKLINFISLAFSK